MDTQGTSEVARGLRFPEGPVAMADGSVLLVEIERGTVSRVTPEGRIEVVADPGGGPNGLAVGPDGRCYVCNNGGLEWLYAGDRIIPTLQPSDYSGGRIEAVDLDTGAVEVLYTASDRGVLTGPNDIVFDADGGFWFTDHGKIRAREQDRGFVCYARIDGSECREVIRALESPNGIGLSPDGTRLYVAETSCGRLWSWRIVAPGKVHLDRASPAPNRGHLIAGLAGYQFFDSLAVDGDGHVCVATIHNGGITVVSPDDGTIEHVATDDPVTTNICFGGADLRTAFITLSSTGRLVSMPWPRSGLPLNFLNREASH